MMVRRLNTSALLPTLKSDGHFAAPKACTPELCALSRWSSHCGRSRRWRPVKGVSNPEDAFRQACQELGIGVTRAEEELDAEEWDDIQEEMEDFWMRQPQAASDWEEQQGALLKEEFAEATHLEGMSLPDFRNALDLTPTKQGCILNVAAATASDQTLPTRHIPLEQLTREAAESLREFEMIGVIGSDPRQTRQACIRLQMVFHLQVGCDAGVQGVAIALENRGAWHEPQSIPRKPDTLAKDIDRLYLSTKLT